MYTRNFFRATWLLTSMDAGFFTAMHIKNKPLRDLLSVILTVVFAFFPDAADEKVRRYRHHVSIQLIRTSWEKSLNPYLKFITMFERGMLPIRKNIQIPPPNKPSPSAFRDIKKGPVKARLYFNGSANQLLKCHQLIFHVPGGGFVAMSPENHDEYVSNWARQTQLPILSINYGKAPEHPYPWALEQCFEAYRSVVESNGEVIGLGGSDAPPISIIIVGDSAGGNLATGVVIKCLESSPMVAPPRGVLLIYPALSFDLACWMSPQHLNLLRTQSHIELTDSFLKSKTLVRKNEPLSVDEAPRGIDVFTDEVDTRQSLFERLKPAVFSDAKDKTGPYIHSYLSMTSRMHYFDDRVLPPEYLRAMAIMYLAESPIVPDLENDYYLSPILAPNDILAKFPKTYILCGEKDPLLDDTIVLMNRIKQAKIFARKRYKSDSFDESLPPYLCTDPDDNKLKILPGISHGFFQCYTFLPEAKQATRLTSLWFKELFHEAGTENFKKSDLMLYVEEGSVLKRRRNELAHMVLPGDGTPKNRPNKSF